MGGLSFAYIMSCNELVSLVCFEGCYAINEVLTLGYILSIFCDETGKKKNSLCVLFGKETLWAVVSQYTHTTQKMTSSSKTSYTVWKTYITKGGSRGKKPCLAVFHGRVVQRRMFSV